MMQTIKGFKDILPDEAIYWQWIESVARNIFDDFGFSELRPPILETAELFNKSIGEATDIVEKEMYTLADRGGDLITLRPEATASVVRAYIQHKLYADNIVRRLYSMGPMFRRERPQKGRYRQFHQINAEVFGVESPYMDAQLILMLMTLLSRLSVAETELHLNSLGCRACRPAYREALSAFFGQRASGLCLDCQKRLTRNPLRILDCKAEKCRELTIDAPVVTAFLCAGCDDHFQQVRRLLTDLNISYALDNNLVRGLDYYTRTTFEVQSGQLGAQNAIAGGGRYDDLVGLLGGPEQPAVGFAIGCERLVDIVVQNVSSPDKAGPDLFIAALGEAGRKKAFFWMCDLNLAGITVEMQFSDKSLKSQMKQADKVAAAWTLIVGEDELKADRVLLRDMATREQQEIPIDDVVDRLKNFLKNETR